MYQQPYRQPQQATQENTLKRFDKGYTVKVNVGVTGYFGKVTNIMWRPGTKSVMGLTQDQVGQHKLEPSWLYYVEGIAPTPNGNTIAKNWHSERCLISVQPCPQCKSIGFNLVDGCLNCNPNQQR